MTPFKSSSNKENCSPVSSNCVIWQGANLPCIGLCTGDSVSDVIYRVAETVCELKENFNLTDVDVTCLLTICAQTPEPQKTITNILNLLINKVCCLNEIVQELINPVEPAEKNVLLAPCFNITNPFGVPLTVLPVSDYVYQMGLKVCTIAGTVATHTSQIANLQTQINNLPPPTPIPQVTPNCVLAPIPADVNLVVDALESQFCSLRTAIGQVADITKVRSTQCENLNTENSLATGKSMTTLQNFDGTVTWNITPANLAQSLQNLWLTVCDLRGAVKFIQDNCCKFTCADLLVDFDVAYTLTTNQSTGITYILLTFFFGGDGVDIPAQFYDCDQLNFTKLTVTDESGNSAPITLKIRDLATQKGILDGTPTQIANGTGITLPLTIKKGDTLTITGDMCLTDGTTTCTKCISKVVEFTDSICCEITALTVAENPSAAPVTILYTTC